MLKKTILKLLSEVRLMFHSLVCYIHHQWERTILK